MVKTLFSWFFASLLCVLTIGQVAQATISPKEQAATAPLEFLADASSAMPDGSDLSQAGFVPPELPESDNPTGNRQVIGNDDRLPVTSRAYPWSAIGRLEHLDRQGQITSICTGSLIGDDLVITNAHCVVDENTHRLTRDVLRFRPNLINGRTRVSGFATQVRYGDNAVNGFFGEDDWALVRLDQPIGKQYGTIGWRTLSSEQLKRLAGKISLVGYSADFPQDNPGETAGTHRGCDILGDGDYGFLRHNCDTFGGASGGPLLAEFDGRFSIVALHAGTYETVNRAIKVSRWASNALAMKSP